MSRSLSDILNACVEWTRRFQAVSIPGPVTDGGGDDLRTYPAPVRRMLRQQQEATPTPELRDLLDRLKPTDREAFALEAPADAPEGPEAPDGEDAEAPAEDKTPDEPAAEVPQMTLEEAAEKFRKELDGGLPKRTAPDRAKPRAVPRLEAGPIRAPEPLPAEHESPPRRDPAPPAQPAEQAPEPGPREESSAPRSDTAIRDKLNEVIRVLQQWSANPAPESCDALDEQDDRADVARLQREVDELRLMLRMMQAEGEEGIPLPAISDTEKDYVLVWSAADQLVQWIETTEECP